MNKIKKGTDIKKFNIELKLKVDRTCSYLMNVCSVPFKKNQIKGTINHLYRYSSFDFSVVESIINQYFYSLSFYGGVNTLLQFKDTVTFLSTYFTDFLEHTERGEYLGDYFVYVFSTNTIDIQKSYYDELKRVFNIKDAI